MAEKENKLVIILLILALLFFLYYKGVFNIPSKSTDTVGLSVQYYDANMKEITPSKTFATLTRTYPPTGIKTSNVAYLNLSVYLRNKGTVPLTCEVTEVKVEGKPASMFKIEAYKNNGMPKWIMINPSSVSSRAWSTHPLIATNEFLPISPATSVSYTLNVTITCNDTPTNFLKPKSSWVTFLFENDPQSAVGDFDVTLTELFPSGGALCNGAQLDTGEECDGTHFDLAKDTCQEVNPIFTGGTLGCTTSCTFDTSGCTSGSSYVKVRVQNNHLAAHGDAELVFKSDLGCSATDLSGFKMSLNGGVDYGDSMSGAYCEDFMPSKGPLGSSKELDLSQIITRLESNPGDSTKYANSGIGLWKDKYYTDVFYLCGNSDSSYGKAYWVRLEKIFGADVHIPISSSSDAGYLGKELFC